MIEILVGFFAAAWFFTLLGVGYTIYRYVFVPWKVMRKDVAALSQKVEENLAWVKQAVSFQNTLVQTDERAAQVERTLRHRKLVADTVGR